MTVNTKKENNNVTLTVEGRLDTTTAPVLEKTINDECQTAEGLILDLKSLDYISSAGLRVLLGAQKKMQKQGFMKLINVNKTVMDILERTGFANILTIE